MLLYILIKQKTTDLHQQLIMIAIMLSSFIICELYNRSIMKIFCGAYFELDFYTNNIHLFCLFFNIVTKHTKSMRHSLLGVNLENL